MEAEVVLLGSDSLLVQTRPYEGDLNLCAILIRSS